MITGLVTPSLEAILRVRVRGTGRSSLTVQAVIDSGYNGHLSLPPSMIHGLGLPWRRQALALLADGSETLFDVYEATVSWDGRSRRIPVDEADTDPLIGMALLKGFELRMAVRDGGPVAITALV